MAQSLVAFSLVVSTIFQSTWGIVLQAPRQLASSGGEMISIESAPYMAALFLENEMWCEATIIDDEFVLTAAHCLHGSDKNATDDYKVLVGTDQLSTDGIFIEVASILCHEDFDVSTTKNDICLLKLKETVPFGCLWTVDKINLPADDREIVGNTIAAVSGWGSAGNGLSTNELRQAMVPVVGNGCCRRIHPQLTDDMICAGSKYSNFCQSTGGGPLVYNGVLIGVGSHSGHTCGTYPGVYTKVSQYLTWIEDTMENNRW